MEVTPVDAKTVINGTVTDLGIQTETLAAPPKSAQRGIIPARWKVDVRRRSYSSRETIVWNTGQLHACYRSGESNLS